MGDFYKVRKIGVYKKIMMLIESYLWLNYKYYFQRVNKYKNQAVTMPLFYVKLQRLQESTQNRAIYLTREVKYVIIIA